MIPWPIAVLAGFYAILFAMSLQDWRSTSAGLGFAGAALLGMAVSGTLMVGLALMKPWARTMAVWTSVVWMVACVTVAIGLVLSPAPDPKGSLLATALASLHFGIMRYLTQPRVKAWFVSGNK